MPPLHPEYLSQPVQIIVQSAPEWQVWVGAGATLLGAAIGAALGGLTAYYATSKTNDKNMRRAKLEEALAVISEIQEKIFPVIASISIDASDLDEEKIQKIQESALKINFSLTMRLRTLLETHKEELFSLANNAHNRLALVHSRARQIEKIEPHDLDTVLMDPGLEFLSLINDIRDSLIGYLR